MTFRVTGPVLWLKKNHCLPDPTVIPKTVCQARGSKRTVIMRGFFIEKMFLYQIRCIHCLSSCVKVGVRDVQPCFFFSRNIGQTTLKIIYFSLSKKILSGSKYPKNILFYFENRSTDVQLSTQPIQEVPSPLVCSFMVRGYKASIQLCTHELATGNAYVQIEVATTNLSGATKTVWYAYGSSREGWPEQARW